MAIYFLAVIESQVAEILHDHRIRREWFGEERHGMLPFKNVAEDAMSVHVSETTKRLSRVTDVF